MFFHSNTFFIELLPLIAKGLFYYTETFFNTTQDFKSTYKLGNISKSISCKSICSKSFVFVLCIAGLLY